MLLIAQNNFKKSNLTYTFLIQLITSLQKITVKIISAQFTKLTEMTIVKVKYHTRQWLFNWLLHCCFCCVFLLLFYSHLLIFTSHLIALFLLRRSRQLILLYVSYLKIDLIMTFKWISHLNECVASEFLLLFLSSISNQNE